MDHIAVAAKGCVAQKKIDFSGRLVHDTHYTRMQTDYIKVTHTNKKIAEQLLDGPKNNEKATYTGKVRVKSYDDVLKNMLEQMEGSWMMHLDMYRSGVLRPQLMRTKEAAVEYFAQETKKNMRRAIEEGISAETQATLVYLPVPMSIWKMRPDAACAAIMCSIEVGTPLFNWIQETCESFSNYYIVPEVRAFIDDDPVKSFIMPTFGFVCRRKIDA
jgi:hypothetical protein